jgi:hypothetical protein
MIVKIHKKGDRTVVAVCDTEIFKKKFEEGNLQLDLSSDFYDGVEMPDIETGDIVRNADSVNLVGEKAVEIGIKEDVIDSSHVKKIAGIPYAQGILVSG